ncbi:hypothetical protein ALI44B_00655 [Leifsonia sp. ALI-44-B]|nr:hypothetical protein ALI44B_00655 [Leifsonia sp. ALI-44-B]
MLVGIGVSSAAALPPFPSEIPKQPAARAGEVSVGATGDILLYDVEHTIPADNAASYLDNVRPWFAQDIVTGNLEQAISDDTGYDKCGQATDCLTFRSDPAAARGLADFDILNLANNHTRDFGQAGYDNTRTALEIAGIRAVGDRNEIAYTQVGDTTVAIVGFTSYTGFNRVTDLRHLRTIVRTATEHADIVIVHAHMGAEGPAADAVTPGTETMYGENRGDPIAFAHAAIDAGADSVIGHGPHVLRGMEWYGGRLIAYSLGNFGGGGVFGKDASTRYGAYLALRFRSDGTIITGHVQSVRFDYGNGVPLPDSENRAAELINEKGNRDFPQTAAIIGSDGALTAP